MVGLRITHFRCAALVTNLHRTHPLCLGFEAYRSNETSALWQVTPAIRLSPFGIWLFCRLLAVPGRKARLAMTFNIFFTQGRESLAQCAIPCSLLFVPVAKRRAHIEHITRASAMLASPSTLISASARPQHPAGVAHRVFCMWWRVRAAAPQTRGRARPLPVHCTA